MTDDVTPDEPLWTIDQLADYLQVSVKTVRKWREVQQGPRARLVGKHLRYKRSDVVSWIDTR